MIDNSVFANCIKLVSITIPNSVTYINDFAFASCSALTSITIPDSVTTIAYAPFQSCTQLASVTLTPTSRLTSIDRFAFSSCPLLTSILIPPLVTNIGTNNFLSSGLSTVTILNGQVISGTTFSSPASGVSFFGVTVNTIGLPGQYTFSGTGTLDQLTVTNNIGSAQYISIQGYTDISNNAFFSKTQILYVIIGTSVTTIGISAFQACTNLTPVVTIPASVTSIGISAFQGCFSLTSINVNTSNTTYSSLDGVLFNKLQTTLVEFPPGKSTSYIIPDSVTTIGTNAFIDVNGLLSVTIPDSVTTIGTNAFQSCNSLSTVTITLNSTLISIGDQAFRTCPALTSIIIPPLVTTIGISAFQGCSTLTSIAIPALVTSIGTNAFTSSGLLTVTIGVNPQTISTIVFTAPSTVTFFGKANVSIVYP
jgi:hypothetical protein